MIKFELNGKNSVHVRRDTDWEGRKSAIADLHHILTTVRCNGIVSLKHMIAEGSRRPQLRDSDGRFLPKETSPKPDTVYLSEQLEAPNSEVWYHLDLTTDAGHSTISVVSDGEIICPTYQTGWGHSECQWQKEWRLLRRVNELSKDFQWRASILGRLTALDRQLIEAAINEFWSYQKETNE